MSESAYVDNAKVMAKGQITIPKEIRERLGVSTGDRVTFIVNGDSVLMMNAAQYAMSVFQDKMKGEAEKAGFKSEEDLFSYMSDIRKGSE